MHRSMLARLTPRLLLLPVLLLGVTVAACSEDEATAPESHTPASAKLFVNDVDMTADLVLPAGATTAVEVRFYAADGDEITTIEADHYASLTFSPGTIATPVARVDQHFTFDVTAQGSAGTGTVDVGYGHDAAADELTFGPFPVTVP